MKFQQLTDLTVEFFKDKNYLCMRIYYPISNSRSWYEWTEQGWDVSRSLEKDQELDRAYNEFKKGE